MPERQGASPTELARALAGLAEQGRRAVLAFLEGQPGGEGGFAIPEPKVVRDALTALARALLADPERLRRAQEELRRQMEGLWQWRLRREAGEPVPLLIAPGRGDRRFKDPAWSQDPAFAWLVQAYLLVGRWLQGLVAEVPGLEPRARAKAAFYTRQLVDALAPTNFAALNPAVLRRAAETEGRSLSQGLERLLADLERGKGELRPRATREGAFAVGRDLATTPGKVIFENELMQLIQYAPTTKRVRRRPLLIVPPWINKYYILDLRPENSFVRYCVGQGFTVFLISWVNPGERHAGKTFDSYLEEGPLTALDAIERAIGEREMTALGYCLGGTLLACLMAWLAAKGENRVRAATFLTTLLDFAEPGELAVFIDDEQLEPLERHMAEKGYLEARHMQKVFSLLRANDLIWGPFVESYLMGREPPALDLLHWNADGTRMPAAMHGFYLRSMYQKNLLAQPGGITLKGAPIDLGQIEAPCYFLSTREDHIAPWASTYRGARRLGGPVRFTLAGSGHVAGVVNPPASGKYGYWANPRRPKRPEAWLARAERREGSWWPDWAAWLARRSGREVPARAPERGGLAPIEDAPGRYVLARAEDEGGGP